MTARRVQSAWRARAVSLALLGASGGEYGVAQIDVDALRVA
jgi:hypothetical protein